jgi:hypothetical protein
MNTVDTPGWSGFTLAAKACLLLLGPLSQAPLASQAQPFDIAPFARRCPGTEDYHSTTTFDYSLGRAGSPQFEPVAGRYVCALQWAEERDVQEVRLHFVSAYTGKPMRLDYWYENWPYPPPTMPSMEDPVDDPWQGRWLQAVTEAEIRGRDCRLTFLPLGTDENPKAANLPGLRYRRTLKFRLVCDEPPPALQRLQVFSGSTQTNVTLRIELGVNGTLPSIWEGRLAAYNGAIQDVRGWQTTAADAVTGAEFRISAAGERGRKGLVFDVQGTSPAPSGSHDITIVTFQAGQRTFSFALPDVENGPIYLPDFDSCVSLASNPGPFTRSLIKQGGRLRERLAREPEQTYERATKEIPALDPVEREGDRLYLPLTIDSSWQKFAVAWGGNVFLHKEALKAKGAELRRLEWQGDRLEWRFGTGADPTFRPGARDSRLSVLEDFLPVAIATWTSGEIDYREETFATSLAGPLGWEGRDEQSPVVLMVKITARNTAAQPRPSHLWLGLAPSETLRFESNELLASDGQLVRARVVPSAGAKASLASFHDDDAQIQGVHLEATLAPGTEESTLFVLPFLPRLTSSQRLKLGALNYEQERAKVVAYWRAVAESGVRFDVPEQRFVSFSRAMLVHMRLSTTKDPKSGLFMVPAASYSYQVFANESCFQILALDALGDHKTAGDYLETFIQLQGSKPFPGTYSGDQRAVYHGAKVNSEYDYTAADYNLDHGTVLWTLAEHYFMTRDQRWLAHAAPGMVRAADWVTEQRRQTMALEDGQPVAEYGLLPAGHLEDNADWGHWFAANAYASAGMSRLGQALKESGHPEADRISHDAEAFRADLRQAVIRASQVAPVTRLRDKTYIPYVPVRPHQRYRLFGPLRVDYYRRYPNPVLPIYRLSATREVLYGPLILLNLGIFQGREALAGWVLDDWEDNLTVSSSFGLNVHGWVADQDWFSRGGMVFQANLQNPVLAYLRRQEIPAALRNFYNDFVACLYPEVNVFTEEFHMWRSASGPFYKVPDEARFVTRLRDLLVHEEGTGLWLAAGAPRRWLEAGQKISLRQMPTTFGPVDLELEARENEIVCQVRLPSRDPPTGAWLVLRAPEGKALAAVELDGKPWLDFDPQKEAIRLPLGKDAPVQIRARLTSQGLKVNGQTQNPK